TATTSDNGRQQANPVALLEGDIDHDTIRRFRKSVFSSVRQIDRMRDWTSSPMAGGVQRGLVLWALGNHGEAVEELEPHRDNPAIAACLARSYAALRRFEDAEAVLKDKDTDPVQAAAWLHTLEQLGDVERFRAEVERLKGVLPATDATYFEGRVKEFDHDTMGAIAAYDE